MLEKLLLLALHPRGATLLLLLVVFLILLLFLLTSIIDISQNTLLLFTSNLYRRASGKYLLKNSKLCRRNTVWRRERNIESDEQAALIERPFKSILKYNLLWHSFVSDGLCLAWFDILAGNN